MFTAIPSGGICSETQENTSINADLDGDGLVNENDYEIIKAIYGICTGEEGFVPEADYNDDGCITLDDHVLWVQAKEETS